MAELGSCVTQSPWGLHCDVLLLAEAGLKQAGKAGGSLLGDKDIPSPLSVPLFSLTLAARVRRAFGALWRGRAPGQVLSGLRLD